MKKPKKQAGCPAIVPTTVWIGNKTHIANSQYGEIDIALDNCIYLDHYIRQKVIYQEIDYQPKPNTKHGIHVWLNEGVARVGTNQYAPSEHTRDYLTHYISQKTNGRR